VLIERCLGIRKKIKQRDERGPKKSEGHPVEVPVCGYSVQFVNLFCQIKIEQQQKKNAGQTDLENINHKSGIRSKNAELFVWGFLDRPK